MDAVRRDLTALRNGLLRLHKTLLDSERGTYEHDVARIRSSSHLLELVLHDPWFAWLHELSEFIVRIDETLDSEEAPTVEDAFCLLRQARSLLVPAENGRGFEKCYFEALQRDPNVVMCHSEMRKLLSALGQPC
ncbi:MAG TPA: hypothetical protein VFA33_12480 [Bryobacteraceae bacterium]|nr:hypothetical protein [Bryobacteraceae bacterium]